MKRFFIDQVLIVLLACTVVLSGVYLGYLLGSQQRMQVFQKGSYPQINTYTSK